MKYDGDDPRDVYFETRLAYDARRDLVWKEVCRFLQKRYISVESRILDAGAGYCNFINNITGREKHALDISIRVADWADPDVVVHVGSCTSMDCFEDSSLDVVFASNLFEHLTREQLRQTLSEVHRVLRAGGRLIILQPNFKYCYRSYFDDYTHIQIFTHGSLCDLLRAHGFEVIDVKPRFLPVNMKSTLDTFCPPKLDLAIRLYMYLTFRPLAGQMLIVAENCTG